MDRQAASNFSCKFLSALFLFAAVISSANELSAQEQKSIQQGSRWVGQIFQGNQSFPTTIYISDRNGNRMKGEIDFNTPSGRSKLTFQGNIIDNNMVVWITDKKEGNVTYPGLYFGKISGNKITGTWQVPSAGQYDRFSVMLIQ
jgi:hypothetical protein